MITTKEGAKIHFKTTEADRPLSIGRKKRTLAILKLSVILVISKQPVIPEGWLESNDAPISQLELIENVSKYIFISRRGTP